MDRVRSFFEDLRLFDDNENNTDTDKSSSDTKSFDVEDSLAITMQTSVVTSTAQDALSHSLSTTSRQSFLQRTRSAHSNKSNSISIIPIRKVTNSLVEEEDDFDDFDDRKRVKRVALHDFDSNLVAIWERHLIV
jgi:hypothetical protein